MGKFEITKAELVWPGKYDDDGKRRETPSVSPLPFQVIERVNESRATREARRSRQASLFEFWRGGEGDTFEEGWRNKLIWGDNLLVMRSLLRDLAGKIDLIYIDPPFATGSTFSFPVEIGDHRQQAEKAPSIIEERAYNDTWGEGVASWLAMIHPRLVLMRDLLSEKGSIFVHMDQHMNSYLRLLLDEVFGRDHFRNEIIWCYPPKGKGPTLGFHQKHDVIYYYGRIKDSGTFSRPYQPLNEKQEAKFSFVDADGRHYKDIKGRRVYLDESKGRPIPSWWTDIGQTGQSRIELIGYPTQKPVSLLKRIISASTNPGDLVADFFCGSGTTLVAAESSGRRWVGCDLGRYGVHVSRKRLLGIADCQPFDVLNLGKYERQYWRADRFPETGGGHDAQHDLYEYLKFILDLYGANPLFGHVHLHGRKDAAVVHVGAHDAPVTFAEIENALEECRTVGQKELHVLGWEWEMGLVGPNQNEVRSGLIQQHAARHGIRLRLKRIPREVMDVDASDNGGIRFYELAYVDAVVEIGKNGRVRVVLRDFVVPNNDPETQEVRQKITKWMDWVDYWAVDWDFREDTFRQGWVAYRTRTERSLPEESGPHKYEEPGTYRVLVKVVDIFGNDTSLPLGVEVR